MSRKSTREVCAAQGLDKGILFCTYSLLLQKSVSTKEMAKQQKANPHSFHDTGAASIAEGKAFREAAIGTVEFGEATLCPRRKPPATLWECQSMLQVHGLPECLVGHVAAMLNTSTDISNNGFPAMCWTGPGSRLAQIVEWCGGEGFDGAIVFDECHRCSRATHPQKLHFLDQGCRHANILCSTMTASSPDAEVC